MRAWHFVGDKLRDGRPVPADGEWLEHDGPVFLCESGLHASLDPFDALSYAPGATLCLVDIDGIVVHGNDKIAASRRRIVARRNVTVLCRQFAREQALSVIHMWDAPEVVRRYLKTGEESLRGAAWAAAKEAARVAAMSAPGDAALDVTLDATTAEGAWVAAKVAARDAAWAAARGASWESAWRTQIWPSEWSTAWAAARRRFNEMVEEAFK